MTPLDPRLQRSVFIAGTDTGVGKTWVATRLLEAWVRAGFRAAGMKPVAAGAGLTAEGLRNDDALALLAAGNVGMRYEWLNPVCLARPTSPHLAARETGIDIDIGTIVRSFDHIVSISDLVAVEGAGGWHAPIGDPADAGTRGPTMADVAVALGLPVILVVGLRLGCLNHALLSLDAIDRSGLSFAGWVANPGDTRGAPFADRAAYVESLERRLPVPLVTVPGVPLC